MNGALAGAIAAAASSALLVALLCYFYVRPLLAARREAEAAAQAHQATVEALALAIDAKDQSSVNHIRRVVIFATGLARAMGLPAAEVRAIGAAALLHDVGKLAVPEHILSKPGPLTREEFQKVRTHARAGAEILGEVPFPQPVAPLVLSHHERWDGRGYPDGLRGNGIPVGARILAVVDCYDVLTSERPYHRAMSSDAARLLLQQEAGRALDPAIVDLFLRLLPEFRQDVDRALAGSAGAASAEPTVYSDIALAHREIYALYEIAQSIGTTLGVSDTMSLIAAKLVPLVPFSSCALFLTEPDGDALRCVFATGVDAGLLGGLTLRPGQGLTGWVARNRRPLVNARPAADLEAVGAAAGTALQSALVWPLEHGDRFIGTLNLCHEQPGFYTDDHRRIFDRIAEQAAAVLHNSIVFERTREDALTDPLTGLPNTRFLLIHVARELARAERLRSDVAMIVLDLDDFKEINDTHGHHVGDQALRQTATVLRSSIRPYDICVRYAGDEFIIVLAGCGRDEAERKRTDLQQAVNRASVTLETGAQVPLRISAGASVFPHDGATHESLLARADVRMYHDKAQRREAATNRQRPGTPGTPSTRAVL
ncbi:MAG: diguanylate cyclase [Acidimicrobiia bacterium]|nr:diguanylate cyclase [Acidimicrobiia bacterium]